MTAVASALEHHERWMRLALELADEAARANEVPVGAVVVAGERVIGRGSNRPITSRDPTAHAEMVALREAALEVGNYRLAETTLYVTVEPCTMCAGALVHARVATLVFGTREPKAGAVVSHPSWFAGMNHRIGVVEGVLADACAERMRSFFAARR